AVRLPAATVKRLLVDSAELHRRYLAYTHELLAQITQSAVCNRFHNARERLARWLLMTADRARKMELPVTHECIAYMVGGPRSAATQAAGELRDLGAISYRRGLLIIRDSARLRELACECYKGLRDDSAIASGTA